MKNLLFVFVFLFFGSIVYSQNTNMPKTETKGELQEVTLFYENGNIMQHGFYTKDGKLHASWESYNLDGTKKCYATYNYGVKVGVWTYWSNNKITKIEYDNNKIINITELDIQNSPKNNL